MSRLTQSIQSTIIESQMIEAVHDSRWDALDADLYEMHVMMTDSITAMDERIESLNEINWDDFKL